jgi:hypothetical protein
MKKSKTLKPKARAVDHFHLAPCASATITSIEITAGYKHFLQ